MSDEKLTINFTPSKLFWFVFRNLEGKEVGRLYEKDGAVHFEGEATEAAKVFIQHLKQQYEKSKT